LNRPNRYPPLAIEHQALHLPDKVRHRGGHLDLLFGVEETTQVDRADLHGAVATQDRFGCGRNISKNKIWIKQGGLAMGFV